MLIFWNGGDQLLKSNFCSFFFGKDETSQSL